MTLTRWINATTGQPLDRVELAGMQQRARRVYEANTHIFEDEVDALVALGIVSSIQADALGAPCVPRFPLPAA